MKATAANTGRGAEASRRQLIDAAERVFLKEGHARISYRGVAAQAGLTASLVQYYFPTIDSLIAAMIQRLIDRDTERWNRGFSSRPHEPLRVLWEYSWAEAAGAFGTEMMTLGATRPALLDQISAGTESIRRLQIDALQSTYDSFVVLDQVFTPEAMVLLVTSIPKVLTLENAVQVTLAHRPLIEAFERYLDAVEPQADVGRPGEPPTRLTGRRTSPGSQRRDGVR